MRNGLRAVLLLGLAAGCAREVSRTERPLADGLLSGCSAVLAGGRCEAKPGAEIAFWIPETGAAKIAVTIDGAPAQLTNETRGSGRRLTFAVPERGETIAFEVLTATVARRLQIALDVVATATPADAARREAFQEYESARALLREGDPKAAVAKLDRVVERTRTAEPSRARRAILLGVYILGFPLGDIEGAERRLNTLDADDPLDGEGIGQAAYYRSLIAARAGDWRRASTMLETAEAASERLGLGIAPAVRQQRGLILVELGRSEEARQLFSALVDQAARSPPCWRADIIGNAAWTEVSLGRSKERALALLRKALALHGPGGECESVPHANNVRVNLALLYEQEGATGDAEKVLRDIAGEEQPEARLWRRALEARLLLAHNSIEAARAAFRALVRDADLASLAAISWQARVGLGRVEEAAARLDAARDAYASAEDLLDRHTRLAPIDRGRLAYAEDRAESGDGLIRVLLQKKDPRAAFRAARRARRRALAEAASNDAVGRLDPAARAEWALRIGRYRRAREALDAALRDVWQTTRGDAQQNSARLEELGKEVRSAFDEAIAMLPQADALGASIREPAPGEVFLLARPETRGGWLGFAARENGVKTTHLADPSAHSWLAAFEAIIRSASRITVFATGESASLDLHTAELDGAPLLARRSVVYALDLPTRAREPGGKHALIAADPRGDLPRARSEGIDVARRLKLASWSVDMRAARAADAAGLLAGLPQAELFHFAGHARYAGAEGWQSGLAAADRELGIDDILALPQAPRSVVLSACESAVAAPSARIAGLGLAQSFLIAGAAAVVATGARVEDETANAFAAALYDAFAETGELEPAYRRAILALEAERRACMEFRLMVP